MFKNVQLTSVVVSYEILLLRNLPFVSAKCIDIFAWNYLYKLIFSTYTELRQITEFNDILQQKCSKDATQLTISVFAYTFILLKLQKCG